MSKRTITHKKIDRPIFKRTAAQTKLINIDPKNMRGGIRL